MISQETIKKFQDATEEELGVALDIQEATEILQGTVAFLDLLAKINSRPEPQAS